MKKGMMPIWIRCAMFGLIPVIGIFVHGTPVACGDDVVKDHLPAPSTVRISNWIDTGSTLDYVAAAAFTGNGEMLKQVEGFYWSVGSSGTANAADWAAIDFELIFYENVAAFQADPLLGTQKVQLLEPDNIDWLTPVSIFFDASVGQSFDVLHFVFDVESLGILTTAGQTQLVALTPTGDLFTDGQTGMLFSTGLAGVIGLELDQFVNFASIPQTGPDTLQSLGAPFDYVTYRVVLGDVPCPADSTGDGEVTVLDLLALLAVWGPCPPPCPEDSNEDGEVTVLDLLAMLGAWGACP